MGVDALIVATGDLTSSVEPGAGHREFERCYICDMYCPRTSHEHIKVRMLDDRTYVMLDITLRYFGLGFKQGPWPSIYNGVRAMMHLFPRASVYYAADVDEEWEVDENLCTAERLDALWTLYFSTL
jgi:hypothetical protein